MNEEYVNPGQLEIAYGTMGSSKTGWLFNRVNKFDYFKKDFLFIKPDNDTRNYGYIWSRDYPIHSYRAKMLPANRPDLIVPFVMEQKELNPNLTTIGFDELQFWLKNPDNGFEIDHALYELLLKDFHLLGALLPHDFRGELFGRAGEIIALADNPIKRTAACEHEYVDGSICSMPAHWTQRLRKGEPVSYYDPIILPTGEDAEVTYGSRCAKHHIVLESPRNYKEIQDLSIEAYKRNGFEHPEHSKLIRIAEERFPTIDFRNKNYGSLETLVNYKKTLQQ